MSLTTRLIAQALLLPLLLIPLQLLAGGKAIIEMGDGNDRARMQVEFDGDALRMGMEQTPHTYTLLHGDSLYSVMQQPGEAPRVVDMAAMIRLAGNIAAANSQNPFSATDEVVAISRLEDTGRRETIAGIRGRVHLLTYTDTDGRQHTEELVLSNDARLRDMQQAMQSMGMVMARATGQLDLAESNLLQNRLDSDGQGMLRYGDQYRVVEVSGRTPPATRFELPAEPMALPGMGMLGGMAAGDTDTGSREPGLIEEKVDRQQRRVEDRTERQVDRATDRAVDKAVDKAISGLKGLFGG